MFYDRDFQTAPFGPMQKFPKIHLCIYPCTFDSDSFTNWYMHCILCSYGISTTFLIIEALLIKIGNAWNFFLPSSDFELWKIRKVLIVKKKTYLVRLNQFVILHREISTQDLVSCLIPSFSVNHKSWYLAQFVSDLFGSNKMWILWFFFVRGHTLG